MYTLIWVISYETDSIGSVDRLIIKYVYTMGPQ